MEVARSGIVALLGDEDVDCSELESETLDLEDRNDEDVRGLAFSTIAKISCLEDAVFPREERCGDIFLQ